MRHSDDGLMVAFELSADKKTVVLPQDDGYPVERSEGFYTNMSELSDVSSEASSHSADSDAETQSDYDGKENENDSGEGGNSSQSSLEKPCSRNILSQVEEKASHADRRKEASESRNGAAGRYLETGAQRDTAVIYTPDRKYDHLNAERKKKIRLAKLRAGIPLTQPSNTPCRFRPVLNKKIVDMAKPEHLPSP